MNRHTKVLFSDNCIAKYYSNRTPNSTQELNVHDWANLGKSPKHQKILKYLLCLVCCSCDFPRFTQVMNIPFLCAVWRAETNLGKKHNKYSHIQK